MKAYHHDCSRQSHLKENQFNKSSDQHCYFECLFIHAGIFYPNYGIVEAYLKSHIRAYNKCVPACEITAKVSICSRLSRFNKNSSCLWAFSVLQCLKLGKLNLGTTIELTPEITAAEKERDRFEQVILKQVHQLSLREGC